MNVLLGVLSTWVLPPLVASGFILFSTSGLKMPSLLWMLRLLRILKTIGIFMKSDLSFKERPPVQLFILAVISFYSLIIFFESDTPDSPLWPWITQVLFVIYTFDVVCRLRLAGCVYFSSHADLSWSPMDSTIVAGGVVVQ